jgi:hypothetical protein
MVRWRTSRLEGIAAVASTKTKESDRPTEKNTCEFCEPAKSARWLDGSSAIGKSDKFNRGLNRPNARRDRLDPKGDLGPNHKHGSKHV